MALAEEIHSLLATQLTKQRQILQKCLYCAILSQPQQMDAEEASPAGSSGSGRGDDPTGRASGEQPLEGNHSESPTPPDGVDIAVGENASTSNSLPIVGDSSLFTMTMEDHPAPLVEQYSSTGPTSGTLAHGQHSHHDLSLVIGEVLDLLENSDDHPDHPVAQ